MKMKIKSKASKKQTAVKTLATIIIHAAILSLVMINFLACTAQEAPNIQNHQNQEEGQGQTRVVTDVLGRQVEIPAEVRTIIALGSGAPRLAAYLGVMDMVVGGEAYMTSEINVLRDYNPVYHSRLTALPIVGAGGGSGDNNGFPEEIIMVSPDVILVGFDREAAEELAMQTRLPVVSVRHATGLATECFRNALRVFAEVTGTGGRGEELLAFIDEAKADLYRRTSAVPVSERPRVYAGAVTWNGRRGFAGTYSVFGIFDAVNAVNVAYVPGIHGFYEASFESIIMWDPDVVFIDPGNMDLVESEYRTNPEFFRSLRAVREGRVYTMPSFNNAGTNITYALINAWYAGIVLFPEQFADVYITEKAGEILTKFLGENTFDVMRENGLFYGQLTIGE